MEPIDLEAADHDELYEHHRFVVDKGQAPLRVDKYLMNRLTGASRNKIQQACDAGCILVNGKETKPSYKVKPLDQVQVVLPEPVREFELVPENIPLNIVFEDEDVIILDKAAGMVVHPGVGNWTGTLMNALVYHFEHLPHFPDQLHRPGLVHRIDKNTSGLMVIARSERALVTLAKEFFERTIDRKYLALVWGEPKEPTGTITGNIGRSLKDRKVMDVFPDGSHGKHAVTHYSVVERFGYVTLVECKLETGRTHQIRAHMKYIGHPLFNDESYGGDKILKGTSFSKYKQFVMNCFDLLPRHALHAATLGFLHPRTGQRVFFESPLPEDFVRLLDKWRKYSAEKES
ncbi:MAG: RluA family pseudouridine synthase [Bacteroidia bacterium]|jgi:23S rRNA pseudouridine1911/1915/1917 synthase|uniref:RluA family pseudouridine synthase n=1 Tax=Candidatus Pollutiaquabacter sp. TaxID=3416354 RepID=UPI001A4A946C|nr:RluA family pseudouridine synthase [Bacteroidota bacterium]MBL7948751.1 RluA family pseudouridine synthase [Bacteroidia bacterium]MBP6009435.1 RluA family pseudouridine synthase [Bacteroidia bacterium]MBP7438391.1 RluA family pseudouridine synthase [Bacteroidia bacterium]MBP7770889.1 RluA family pseudouridine synthase [Bacteroidia bacterium]